MNLFKAFALGLLLAAVCSAETTSIPEDAASEESHRTSPAVPEHGDSSLEHTNDNFQAVVPESEQVETAGKKEKYYREYDTTGCDGYYNVNVKKYLECRKPELKRWAIHHFNKWAKRSCEEVEDLMEEDTSTLKKSCRTNFRKGDSWNNIANNIGSDCTNLKLMPTPGETVALGHCEAFESKGKQLKKELNCVSSGLSCYKKSWKAWQKHKKAVTKKKEVDERNENEKKFDAKKAASDKKFKTWDARQYLKDEAKKKEQESEAKYAERVNKGYQKKNKERKKKEDERRKRDAEHAKKKREKSEQFNKENEEKMKKIDAMSESDKKKEAKHKTEEAARRKKADEQIVKLRQELRQKYGRKGTEINNKIRSGAIPPCEDKPPKLTGYTCEQYNTMTEKVGGKDVKPCRNRKETTELAKDARSNCKETCGQCTRPMIYAAELKKEKSEKKEREEKMSGGFTASGSKMQKSINGYYKLDAKKVDGQDAFTNADGNKLYWQKKKGEWYIGNAKKVGKKSAMRAKVKSPKDDQPLVPETGWFVKSRRGRWKRGEQKSFHVKVGNAHESLQKTEEKNTKKSKEKDNKLRGKKAANKVKKKAAKKVKKVKKKATKKVKKKAVKKVKKEAVKKKTEAVKGCKDKKPQIKGQTCKKYLTAKQKVKGKMQNYCQIAQNSRRRSWGGDAKDNCKKTCGLGC